MMFDKHVFEKGLMVKGVVKKRNRGIDHYTTVIWIVCLDTTGTTEAQTVLVISAL